MKIPSEAIDTCARSPRRDLCFRDLQPTGREL